MALGVERWTPHAEFPVYLGSHFIACFIVSIRAYFEAVKHFGQFVGWV